MIRLQMWKKNVMNHPLCGFCAVQLDLKARDSNLSGTNYDVEAELETERCGICQSFLRVPSIHTQNLWNQLIQRGDSAFDDVVLVDSEY
jgi:hypothetical protein